MKSENLRPAPEVDNSTASEIRSRIEETELQDCLKSSMGGYTKKSVQEYIGRIKKQHQSASDYYNQELRRLLAEKDKLSEENVKLTQELRRTDSEYRNLSEALTAAKLDDSDFSVQDVLTLKSTIAMLQGEVASAEEQALLKDATITQQAAALEGKDETIESCKQELRVYQDSLRAEKNESAAQRRLVSDTAAKLAEQRMQVEYLNKIISEGNVSELRGRIDSLNSSLSAQQELLSLREEQLSLSGAQCQSLAAQLAQAQEDNARLKENADTLMRRNEQLSAVNGELTAKINEMLEQFVALVSEKARINVDRLLAERRLSDFSLGRDEPPQLESTAPVQPAEQLADLPSAGNAEAWK